MKTVLIVILALLFLASVLLDKAYRTLSVKELRRRARSGKDKETASIYKMAAYGDSLKVFLWLVGGISAAILILKAADWAAWAGVLAILIASWLTLMNQRLSVDGFLWKIASVLAVPTVSLLNFLQPVFSRILRKARELKPVHVHTGLYDKEDLLELLNDQNNQIDNRVPEDDLKIAFGALTFGDKTVASIMTPRREIKLVAATDSVGPLLMDELHASGFSRFPVVSAPTKAVNPEIIGTLYIKDLIHHEGSGKVKDVMKKKVYFINEAQTLRHTLDAFLKTQHHLLVVVNNFEEITGVITLEDVIEQIIGKKIVDEFDQYEDMRTVAGMDAKTEHSKHSSPEVVE
jgi:CBS domain containing-hemolysin-like protein